MPTPPLLAALCLVAALAAPARAGEVRVAAAASLQDALREIATAYEKNTGERVLLSFGSSGQLMSQIRNGAPIDAFVSAAGRQVDELEKEGLVLPGTRRVVAGNALVLVVAAAAKDPPASFAALASPSAGRVAVGEPKTVPAGEYAAQVLRHAGVADALRGRLVYGANVRQVLGYVERAEVAAGVVYATDAKAAGAKVRVAAAADPAAHEPIVYPAVVVSASRRRDAAARFLEHLGSDGARAVLADKGFEVAGVADGRAVPADAAGPDPAGSLPPARAGSP